MKIKKGDILSSSKNYVDLEVVKVLDDLIGIRTESQYAGYGAYIMGKVEWYEISELENFGYEVKND